MPIKLSARYPMRDVPRGQLVTTFRSAACYRMQRYWVRDLVIRGTTVLRAP